MARYNNRWHFFASDENPEYIVEQMNDGRFRIYFASRNVTAKGYGPTYIEAFKALCRSLGDHEAKLAGAKHQSYLSQLRPVNHNNIKSNEKTRRAVKAEVYSEKS